MIVWFCTQEYQTDTTSSSRAGDIRSRLVRLIPPAPSGSPLDALRTLLEYRLPSGAAARDEWRAIVEGKSPLWNGVPNDRKEAIRGDHNGRPYIVVADCHIVLRIPCVLRERGSTQGSQVILIRERKVSILDRLSVLQRNIYAC